MAVRGLPADAELAPDLSQRQLFNPRQQEHLARARWQRGDDRVEVAQLFGVEQSLLGQWCRIGDGLQLRVIQYLFATALALPVVIRDQVVGDAVQIGAAVAQQAAGGDFDDTQPGFLDDVIGVAALREFAADMGVQRPVMGRAQLRDIRRFDRRGHGAGDNWEREQPAAARAAAAPYSKRESFASMARGTARRATASSARTIVAVDLQGFGGVVMQLEAALLQAALHPRDGFGMTGNATILPARWGEHAQGQQPQPLAVQYQ